MAKAKKEVRRNQPVQGRSGPAPRVLLPVEAAELLRVSIDQLYHLTSKKKVPFVKVGGALRFDRARLLDFIANSPPDTTDGSPRATAGSRKGGCPGIQRGGYRSPHARQRSLQLQDPAADRQDREKVMFVTPR